MTNITVIADSGCDITQEEAKLLGIRVLPLKTRFGDEEYRDGIDMTPGEFYDRLIESDELPSTSQVNPQEFIEAFQLCRDRGEEVLCITISQKLSGCYRSALLAAQEFDHVTVFDSEAVSIGENAIVHQALAYIKAGKSVEEVVSLLEEDRRHLVVLALMDTLEYLKRGGRISKAAAAAGSLLSIKPVITLVDGAIEVIGKAHGSKKGKNLLSQCVEKHGGINFSKPYCIGYSGNQDYLLRKYLEDNADIYIKETQDVPIIRIGSTVGTHAGPGAIAVGFFTNH